MRSGRTTARFIAAFCAGYEIDPSWLLFGRGPMRGGRQRPPGAVESRLLRNADRWDRGVAERLAIAVGDDDRDRVARRTKMHPENIRRHLLTGRISARVLVLFCRAYRVDPMWVLFGRGRMRSRG
jgi:hypothetical protein